MGRPVVLSNGQMFVGLDEHGLVHDFYYPYVGLENLTNARSVQHKVGVWVDGSFSWTDDGTWQIKAEMDEDALIGNIEWHSDKLDVTITTNDFVDTAQNAFIRQIHVKNNASESRDVRLFMHQVFELSNAGRADTALYVPEEHYILDYKGRYVLLISGKATNNDSFDQYAVGNYAIEGKAGTFLDAEDGELSGNAVEHGGVDSVIRFSQQLEGGETLKVDYWIIAASSQADAQATHTNFIQQDMDERLGRTRLGWEEWVQSGLKHSKTANNKSLKHSLLIIKAHCDERGSVLASGDSSIFNYGRDYYCYCWPRDAACALLPLIRLGHFEETKSFLKFAQDTHHRDGYLMHKYQPDRAVGSTWHPLIHGKNRELAIQEDETASVLYLIGKYYEASHDRHFVEAMYHAFVVPCANFLNRFIDEETGLPHASYDLWEEKFLTSTYTVCTVIAGLDASSRLAHEFDRPEESLRWKQTADAIRSNLDKLYHPDGYFRKGFLLKDGELVNDDTVDISSLFGIFMYSGLELDDERITSTAKTVEERILNTSPAGGVLRYENDNYFRTKKYPGNPWVVSTLWLAQYYLAVGRDDEAKGLLDWVYARELPSGVLSEQFDPEDASPIGVTPLVWSQAELINTVLDLDDK